MVYYSITYSLFFYKSCKDGHGCPGGVWNDSSTQYFINITNTSNTALGSTMARRKMQGWRGLIIAMGMTS